MNEILLLVVPIIFIILNVCQKNKTFKARKRGKPYSTIFLIRSNITPTDREITVKAEIANNIGGII